MTDYDFRTLSPFEFEVLCRDLIQIEMNRRFESFKPGRDQGVDLRAFTDDVGELVVQCKHYVNSGFSKLKSNLKNSEASKIARLEPARYIIATSVPLSRGNKNALVNTVAPYCHGPQDVFGQEDLNNLLSKYPAVEKNHYKLWITSTSVLERLVHADMFQRADMERDEIEARLALHVQTNATRLAWEILDKNNYCIVSGLPGIGKTTLAEILVADLISRDFELLVARSHVDEVLGRIQPGGRYVVYYDDFLGQSTFSEKLGKNEDQSLLRLLSQSRKHPSLKVVLTTREYLLADARAEYERLNDSAIDIGKCIIDLETYNRGDRARILYNHLYFFEVTQSQIESILDDSRYLNIIDHSNYSPRVIEWVVKSSDTRDSMFERLKSGLDNPLRIWSNVYDNQLNSDARDLLMSLATMRSTTKLDSLQQAFVASSRKGLREDKVERKFRDSLRTLDGTFLRIKRDQGQILVEFANPSIRDFVRMRIAESPSTQRALTAECVFFEQLEEILGRKYDNRTATVQYDDLAESVSRLFFSQTSGVHRVYIGRRSKKYRWWPDRRNLGQRAKAILFWAQCSESRAKFEALLVELLERGFKDTNVTDVGELCDMTEVLLAIPYPQVVLDIAKERLLELADESAHLYDWATLGELVNNNAVVLDREEFADAALSSMRLWMEQPSFDDVDERDYDCGKLVQVAKAFELDIYDDIQTLKNQSVGSAWNDSSEDEVPRPGEQAVPDLSDDEIAELFSTLRQ